MFQITGLTASLGVGKSNNDVDAREYILSICANLDAKNLSTVERHLEELKKHVNLPKEGMLKSIVNIFYNITGTPTQGLK